ncbi:MAG: hypothetical protein U0575_06595 [Phycisphaerales bacterium]
MSKRVLLAVATIAIASWVRPCIAGVYYYRLTKAGVYTQTSTAAPAAATYWYWAAEVFCDTPSFFDEVLADLPGTTPDQLVPPSNATDYTKSATFTSKAGLDAFAGNGDYTIYGYNDDVLAGQGSVNVPGDLYPTALPSLTGDTFTRLQGMNPFAPFVMNISTWSLPPGAASGYIQWRIYDNTGDPRYVMGFFSPGTTSLVIPACTLSAGRPYKIELTYVAETEVSNAGFDGATSDVAFLYWLYADFSTMSWSFDQPRQLDVFGFEGLAEGSPISTTYADSGLTFSLDGQPGQAPVAMTAGAPVVGFSGLTADGPVTAGTSALTDPPAGGNVAAGADVRLTVDPPTTSVRFSIIDIDGNESITCDAFNGDTIVASMTRSSPSTSTGNGVSTEFALVAPAITSVRVDVPAACDWAMDHVRVARPCLLDECKPVVRVSQETTPGAGNFDANVLGYAVAYEAPGSAAQLYNYGGALILPGVPLVNDRSSMLVASTTEGLCLVVAHDRTSSGSGGRAEMQFMFGAASGPPAFLVQDDPTATDVNDTYVIDGNTVRTTSQWGTAGMDGFVLSGLKPGGTVLASFSNVDANSSTATISGLSYWIMASGDFTQFPLKLAADRRVRLEILPAPECPADLAPPGGAPDGMVNGADLGILLSSWGPCPGCAADINGDGVVDGSDLGLLLAAWGACSP